MSRALRSLIATLGVFIFFEILPHFPVGVSLMHYIPGSTLFLILGAGPASIGLAHGLLIHGLFFAPFDLPQYRMNLTTLLVPLFALHEVARRVITPGRVYVDLEYKQVLALSAFYQGGVVARVAVWAVYGAGFGADSLAAIGSFGVAYGGLSGRRADQARRRPRSPWPGKIGGGAGLASRHFSALRGLKPTGAALAFGPHLC